MQIRTDVLSVLIWVQTVCKCYQQITKVTASIERVNILPQNGGDLIVLKRLKVIAFETKDIDMIRNH